MKQKLDDTVTPKTVFQILVNLKTRLPILVSGCQIVTATFAQSLERDLADARQALQFYAREECYATPGINSSKKAAPIMYDKGKRARAALARKGKQQPRMCETPPRVKALGSTGDSGTPMQVDTGTDAGEGR